MPSTTYANQYLSQRNRGNIDWLGGVRVHLMQSGFVFNRDTMNDIASWQGSELATGGGYTNGGQALANVIETKNDALDRSEVSADNTIWVAAPTIGPSAGAMYHDPVNDVTIAYMAFDQDESANNANFEIQHPVFLSTAP